MLSGVCRTWLRPGKSLTPRLVKAFLAGKRPAWLPLPTGETAHFWRAVVLP